MPPTTCKLFRTSASRTPETRRCWAWHYGPVRWCLQRPQTDLRRKEGGGREVWRGWAHQWVWGKPVLPRGKLLVLRSGEGVCGREMWGTWGSQGLFVSQACTRSQPSCWAPGPASTTPCRTGRPCCTWPCSGRTARVHFSSWSTRQT